MTTDTDARPCSTWVADMLTAFPDEAGKDGARVTYLQSPDGTVVRGERGEEGVVPNVRERE